MHELQRNEHKKKKALRRGRGAWSGRGNYSTRGMKGQKARAGYSKQVGFEGGQTPLHMRLPKLRGFKRYFKLLKNVSPVNLASLEHSEAIKAWDTVTMETLVDAGLCRANDTVKILGTGELTKSLTFDGISLFSASAKQKIEKAGGKIS